MLFPRRTWALRVIERMGLPARSPQATLLAEMMIFAAKDEAIEMEVAIGRKLPKPEGVLLAGLAMAHNTQRRVEGCA
jgi:hypothetical protein